MFSFMEDATETFEEHRSRMFAIAYRMLGSVAEAEDVVQETFLRWQRQAGKEIQSAKAWLSTIVTRLCIDHLRSARHQREEYVGIWLPEPLMGQNDSDPAQHAEMADSLTNAFLLMIETLSPVERAVFLLREVFDYDFADVSRMVDKSEANCRQLALRARAHVTARRPRFPVDSAQAERLVQNFLQACSEGDEAALRELLSEEVSVYADGGGKASAARRPVLGAEKVARFFIHIRRRLASGLQAQLTTINAEPGVLIFVAGEIQQSMTFELINGRIRAIYIVRNPDKLKHLTKEK